MGLFDFLKGKGGAAAPAEIPCSTALGAPAKGTFVTMSQIPDNVFSTGVLGACCGVQPSEGKVYAPADGTVSQLTDTLHAIGIEAGGMDILIHVGVDTVEMNGSGFSACVRQGQQVKKGDLLMTMDLAQIKAAGHADTVILIVTNSDDFAEVTEVASGSVVPGDDVLRVTNDGRPSPG